MSLSLQQHSHATSNLSLWKPAPTFELIAPTHPQTWTQTYQLNTFVPAVDTVRRLSSASVCHQKQLPCCVDPSSAHSLPSDPDLVRNTVSGRTHRGSDRRIPRTNLWQSWLFSKTFDVAHARALGPQTRPRILAITVFPHKSQLPPSILPTQARHLLPVILRHFPIQICPSPK